MLGWKEFLKESRTYQDRSDRSNVANAVVRRPDAIDNVAKRSTIYIILRFGPHYMILDLDLLVAWTWWKMKDHQRSKCSTTNELVAAHRAPFAFFEWIMLIANSLLSLTQFCLVSFW